MQKGYEWFSLTFRNTSSGATRDVHFVIGEDALAQKWAGLLRDLLRKKTVFRKNIALSGWPIPSRNLSFLCSELNRHIAIINNFYSAQPADLAYHIPLIFDPTSVDQHLLNLIHHDFEVLVGPTWKNSARFEVAPHFVRLSIEHLNGLCHEIESVLGAQAALREGRAHGTVVVSMTEKERLDFLAEDRSGSQVFFNFGDVRLHYGQMGKTHFDSFMANDETIDAQSITELRYLTGEFDVNFNSDPAEEYKNEQLRAFKEWLHKKGLNTSEHYGFPVVARLDRSQFTSPQPINVMKDLFNYDDIYRISICCAGKVYSRKFKYLWNDPILSKPPPFNWRPLLNPIILLWHIKMYFLKKFLKQERVDSQV